MVTLGKRSGTLESSVSAKHINDDEAKTSNGDEISGYEQCREKRIKANMERMQKLGILDLSRKLKSLPSYSPSPRKQSGRKTPQLSSPLSLSGPSRRSSRFYLFVCVSLFFFPEGFGQRGLISHFHTTPFVCSVHRRSFFLTALLSLVTILCGMRCENGIFYWWETNNVSVSTCFIISLVVSFLWPRNWFCKQCMRFYSFVYGWLDFWVIRSYGLWICLYM